MKYLKPLLLLAALLVFLLSTASANDVKYTLDDFKIGYHFLEDDDPVPEIYKGLGRGISYEEAMKVFPGAENFFYSNPGAFAGLFVSSIHSSKTYPLFSYWELESGELFLVVWECGMNDYIHPAKWFVIEKIPDIRQYQELMQSPYTLDELCEVNPLFFESQFYHKPNIYAELYGYGHSIWLKDGQLVFYTVLYAPALKKEQTEQKVLLEWNDILVSVKLSAVANEIERTYFKNSSEDLQ